MPMCEACSQIKTHDRSVSGHENLEFTGYDKEKAYKPLGQSGVQFKLYACKACDTQWQYEDDKNDRHVGWTIRR